MSRRCQQDSLLEELKENYRKMRQQIADANLTNEEREAKLRAELEASEAELRKALEKIVALERHQLELVSALVPVEMTVTLDMNFEAAGIEGTASREAFEKLFRQDLSNASGVPLKSIKIKRMAAGSLLVDVLLEADSVTGADAYSAALDLKRQVRDTDSTLKTGGLTSSCVNITIKDKKTTLESIERLEKALSVKENSLSLAQHELEELRQRLEHEQRAGVKLSSQLSEAHEQIEVDNMRLKKQENAVIELQDTLAAAGKEIAKLKEEREKNQSEIATVKHQLQMDERELSHKSVRIDELERALEQANDRLEKLMAQSAAERDAIRSLEERLNIANAYIETITRQLSEEKADCESLRTQYRELEATKEREMNAAQAALKQSMEEALNIEKEVSKLQIELHDSHVQVAELWRKVNALQKEVNSTKMQLAVQKDVSDLADVIIGNITETEAALQVLSDELLVEQKFRIEETGKWKLQAAHESELHHTAVDELAVMSATIKNLDAEIEQLRDENNLYKNKVDEILGHANKQESLKRALETENGKLSDQKAELASEYKGRLKQMEQMKGRLDEINQAVIETNAELGREKTANTALQVQPQSHLHFVSRICLGYRPC